MEQNIKVVKVDPFLNMVFVDTVDNSLDGLYNAIGCSMVEIHPVWIEGVNFLYVCDEEALFNGDVLVSMGDKNGNIYGYNRLLFCKQDGEELGSVTDEEAQLVIKHTQLLRQPGEKGIGHTAVII